MRLVIAYDGIKREIDGEFSICLSKEDRLALLHALKNERDEVAYGWIDIREPLEHVPNRQPVAWNAGAYP